MGFKLTPEIKKLIKDTGSSDKRVAIAATAIVVGSVVRYLPTGCSTVVRNGIAYSQCGTVWYEPQYAGNDVTYIVVNNP